MTKFWREAPNLTYRKNNFPTRVLCSTLKLRGVMPFDQQVTNNKFRGENATAITRCCVVNNCLSSFQRVLAMIYDMNSALCFTEVLKRILVLLKLPSVLIKQNITSQNKITRSISQFVSTGKKTNYFTRFYAN